jgi:hypothetical protein
MFNLLLRIGLRLLRRLFLARVEASGLPRPVVAVIGAVV